MTPTEKSCGMLFAILHFAIASSTSAQEASERYSIAPMPDPRPPIFRTFSVGQAAQQTLAECIIVIAWQHPPKETDRTGYQIWGDRRILTKDQLSASLRILCQTAESWAEQPHLLVIGNEWGAGRELDPLLKELSKAHEIDTYYYGASYLFVEVDFREDEEGRRKAIVAAVDAGIIADKQEVTAQKPDDGE